MYMLPHEHLHTKILEPLTITHSCSKLAQSAEDEEYTDYISAGEQDPTNESTGYMTLNHLMVRLH